MPPWARPFFKPKRYKVPYGGRGSSKSWSIADALLAMGAKQRLRILCAREFQKSIKDSVHKLLKDHIELLGLSYHYRVTKDGIYGDNGTEFLFVGLHANVTNVKSMEGIDICWVEEAETVTEDSWTILVPTIRKDCIASQPDGGLARVYGVDVCQSEIWISFNPREETDPTSVRFIEQGQELVDAGRAWIVKVNHDMNPFFPQVLKDEMERDYRVDPDAADWIWGGNYRKRSKAQIMADKVSVQPFEVLDAEGKFLPREDGRPWEGPYFGLDHGYANDPLSAHKYWSVGNTLYVEHELYEQGIELNVLGKRLVESLPGIERGYRVWADSARPETNSHLRNDMTNPLNVEGAKKWSGSVEDGITYLRSLDKIVIHPRCKGAVKEANLYKWKVDRLDPNIIKPEPQDAWNHFWDDCRYAMGPAIEAAEEEFIATQHNTHVIDPDLDAIESSIPGFANIW